MNKIESLSAAPFVIQKIRLIPYKLALSSKCLPFDENKNELFVAYTEPYPFEAFNILSAMSHKQIVPVLLPEDDILKAIEICYQSSDQETKNLILNAQKTATSTSDEDQGVDLLSEEETSPVIKIVNAIFLEAVKVGASDIHFEPSEKGLHVRYRVDGVMILRHAPAKDIQNQIIARVKVLAKLDIAETRLPQDGRLKIKLNKRSIDFRVSVMPVAFGERIVLRILDKSHLTLSLEHLGIPEDVLELIEEAIRAPEGMLLVTGPTGSGKTTTLYSCLNKLLKDPINIMTIEDPVEFRFSGMAQINVNPKINLTFASGLKHILRQDPDVIMIGEIRDFETAEIATQASLTGHRVFSTLHTNDAPSAITRLVDMGIEPYLVCSSLTGVLAQRLVRRICPSCKIKVTVGGSISARFPILENKVFYKGSGCDECFYTGYKGRIGIYEFLKINTELKKVILKTQDADSIKECALMHGFKDLHTQALFLAEQGITTLEEVLAVTKTH